MPQMQFYKVTKLQHLTVVVYCSYLFAADMIPIISHFIAVPIMYIKDSIGRSGCDLTWAHLNPNNSLGI